MTVVMSDYFVGLEVPAFDHLIDELVSPINGTVTELTLSSPHENKYGCLGETARPLTVLICPVRLSFSSPLAKFQILITLSPAPVANHWFPGSTATLRTHPR
jgi:hypothetical protein